MNDVIVYHGGTEIVEIPICKFGRKNLDFGQGFYVTDIRKQAVKWAVNVAQSRNKKAILNRYKLNRNAIINGFHCLIFEAYRTGVNVADNFDYIEGGVANDRVVDTVNLYIAGLMELSTALRELSKHQPNNQMCILNQNIINKYLIYDGAEEL